MADKRVSGGDYPDLENIRLHMPYLEDLAERARFILELGCGAGNGSTRAFSNGLRKQNKYGLLLVSVDVDEKAPQYGGPPDSFWRMVHGSTTNPLTAGAVRSIAGCGILPDILFIDTEHTKQQLALELEIWKVFAGPQTTWLFHDTWYNPATDREEYNPMVDAIYEFIERTGNYWRYEDVSGQCNGLGRMDRA